MSRAEELTRLLRPSGGGVGGYPDSTWVKVAELMLETFAQDSGLVLEHEALETASLGQGLSVDVWSAEPPGGRLGLAYRGMAGCDLIDHGRAARASICLFPYLLGKKVQTLGHDELLEFVFDEAGGPMTWGPATWRAGEPGEYRDFERDWTSSS